MEKFINAMLFVVFRESDMDFGEVDSGRCVLLRELRAEKPKFFY